jgi:hypothetical protein
MGVSLFGLSPTRPFRSCRIKQRCNRPIVVSNQISSSCRWDLLGYYPKGKSRSVQFSTPGVVQVYCHIHADMYGVVVVTPTSWFAMPAKDGSFLLTGSPLDSIIFGFGKKPRA